MATTPTSVPGSIRVAIVGHCPANLWGISSTERIRRQLKSFGSVRLCGSAEAADSGDPVLFLRADYLFEDRTLSDLLSAENILLRTGPDANAAVVAARADASRARAALAAVTGAADQRVADTVSGWLSATVESLSPAYMGKLRKAAAPRLEEIRPDRVDELEVLLFGNAYKGVTDLVTKFVWPGPARHVTGICAERGITPNAVTTASLVLVVLATVLFAQGWLLSGLVLAWIMTFLDTVDGKLARVTVTSTAFGNIFDHGIDLLGPPIWYGAWAYGLAGAGAASDPSFAMATEPVTLLTVIVGAYTVGRIIEGVFSQWVGGFSIFIWQPLDSWFRLIIARRNPNLIFLTLFALAGLPALGIQMVALWTVLCSIFLLFRLGAALKQRPLQPWLQAPTASDRQSWMAGPFL